MDEDAFITCPICRAIFQVVWCNDGISFPEHCPMCGSEIDYKDKDNYNI